MDTSLNNVYLSLQGLFPQVDMRILKAVAIEQPDDLNVAVGDILSNVLPRLPILSTPLQTPQVKQGLEDITDEIADWEQMVLKSEDLVQNTDRQPSISGSVVENASDIDNGSIVDGTNKTTLYEMVFEMSSLSSLSDKIELHKVRNEYGSFASNDLDSSFLTVRDYVEDLDLSSDKEDKNNENDFDYFPEENLSIEDSTILTYNQEYTLSIGGTLTKGNSVDEMFGIDAEPMLNDIVTQSGEICTTDLLEDIIKEAKSNKKILFSTLESVIQMTRDVELKEKLVDEAKGEAAKVGLDILTKAEEIKEMLQSAKELNFMHAGEVYGEKSILATEARELQSRLLNLSEDTDKSLSILVEMCGTLQARLAAAEEEMKAVQQVKLEKEESAERELAKQKDILQKVFEQSNKLLQEADENSKLREFLVVRAHVVDLLQGEISVICQDVRSLKDCFDKSLPLNKSISSCYISPTLSDSTSSLKSTASVQAVQQYESTTFSKDLTYDLTNDGKPPKSNPKGNRYSDDHWALLDDGWDLLDNEDA